MILGNLGTLIIPGMIIIRPFEGTRLNRTVTPHQVSVRGITTQGVITRAGTISNFSRNLNGNHFVLS